MYSFRVAIHITLLRSLSTFRRSPAINISLLGVKRVISAHDARVGHAGTKPGWWGTVKIVFKINKFCPHCKHPSVQSYSTHHPYDESTGGLWDGDLDTAKEPAAYFVFICQTCDEVLLYHYQADEDNFDDLFTTSKRNGVEYMAWNESEIKRNLKLIWPQLWEDIHQYVPKTVRRIYLKALKNLGSPQVFAIEIRKALEAICEDCEIENQDIGGKPKNLSDRIGELSRKASLPPPIVNIAHKIRITGNDAAHSTVNPKIVPLIQNCFRVLINHVYVLPMQIQDWNDYKESESQT